MSSKIITIVGLSFLFFGILLLLFNSLMDRSGLHTVAKVIECQVSEEIDPLDSQKKQFYAPTLTFLDAGGKEHTKKFQKTSAAYSIGQEISIIYNPQKPSVVSVDSSWSAWWLPFFFVIIGAGVILWSFQR